MKVLPGSSWGESTSGEKGAAPELGLVAVALLLRLRFLRSTSCPITPMRQIPPMTLPIITPAMAPLLGLGDSSVVSPYFIVNAKSGMNVALSVIVGIRANSVSREV